MPEDALQREIEKQNRHRGVFAPTDRKAYYETIAVNGFPCLIVREHPKPSERAILYFFGGGMVIGPDKGDLPVMRKLCREIGCDVWFPFYPLCISSESVKCKCAPCVQGIEYAVQNRQKRKRPCAAFNTLRRAFLCCRFLIALAPLFFLSCFMQGCHLVDF